MKLWRNIHRSVWQLFDNCGKVCPTDSDFLAYLVSLDVDVTGNITTKLCEVHGNRGTKIMGWGNVRYCLAMAILVIKSPKQSSLGILNFINISKASTYYGEYSYYVS
jgi:hypothetical protein